MTENKPESLSIQISFPWISSLFAIASLITLLIIKQPQLIYPHLLPTFMSSTWVSMLLILTTIILLLADFQHFLNQKKYLKTQISEIENELTAIWQRKEKLQERSNIHSGQTDKLKRFISDKLLEYIEYDEKFLHFKSIASEVRHNGVISYDIVKTALENANKAFPAPQPSLKSFADTHRFGLPNNPNSNYQQALEAMKYLWDLLDLSTAENIALHIGNHLIACEEQYYQLELNKTKNPTQWEEPPFKPYFAPSFALIKTLGPLLEPNQMDKIIAQLHIGENENKEQALNKHYHETSLFRIYVNKTENLLGNENHLILLLENLVKNAQFFSNRSKFKQKSDRIAVQLIQCSGHIEYKIYNRGPHINKPDLEHIFQLGFSTRRVKEQHGFGLGLFFVKEIVNAYQGQITVNNVFNTENTMSLKIQLINEENSYKEIETHQEDRRIKVKEHDQQELHDNLQWSFDKPIARIEITSNKSDPFIYEDLNIQHDTSILDPEHPFAPEWQLDIKAKRKEWQIKFTPLDINGVEFSIKLPTAEACLNGTESYFMNNFDAEVKQLQQPFSEFDDY